MGTRRRLSLRCVAFVFGAYISIVVVFSVHLLSFTDTHRDHMHRFMYESGITKSKVKTVDDDRAKTGNLRHQVHSDIHLQTVEIQMRRLLMSRLIRTFTVCLLNLLFDSNNRTRPLSEFT